MAPIARAPLTFYHQGLQLLLSTLSAVAICFFISTAISTPNSPTVGYDHRALLINGQRRFLISGSIHYPRSTPQMWPALLNLAKDGGLDVIDTYVFWDAHEPIKGTWNFKDRYDLVAFVQAVQAAGLLLNLRIGPYISAEWNFGGFPEWLREIPGIEFRTENGPFKAEMERFVTHIVQMMQTNNLFLPQGGPIVLAQIENEYRHIESPYGDDGKKYSDWAASMAQNLNTSVPWVMCLQPDAPAYIIDTCNGFYCDHFVPNSYNKPKMWTENYPGWFHFWGEPLPHRRIEDTAYAIARFFQRGGSYMNYYMYHGGTNFGRTAARRITTSYDYHAPIDEYGQARQPDWGHFKNLHTAIKLCEPALAIVDDEPLHWNPGNELEIHVYNSTIYNSTNDGLDEVFPCAAFLANNGLQNATVLFRGQIYDLPAWSVSILPDCRNEVFNTARVATQTSLKTMAHVKTAPHRVSTANKMSNNVQARIDDDYAPLQWEWFQDPVGVWGKSVISRTPLEQYSSTQDLTDYLWYTTIVDLPEDEPPPLLLQIWKVQDLLHVFVNGKISNETLTSNSSGFYQPLNLQSGRNVIALLSVTLGLPSNGPFLEARTAGVRGAVTLHGLSSGKLDLTNNNWTNQVGLQGEHLNLQSDDGSKNVVWSSGTLLMNQPLVWYKTMINTPEGDYPVVLDLKSMGKGAVWINGYHLGRYWPSQTNRLVDACSAGCDYPGKYDVMKKCLLYCGEPSQRWYHVPRQWMKPTENLLVLFEEIGGNPRGVSISRQVVHTICSHIGTRLHDSPFKGNPAELVLDCGADHHIAEISFASLGDPSGECGRFVKGGCHAAESMALVEKACGGRGRCSIRVHRSAAGEDPCPTTQHLSLAVQALCKPS